MRAASTKAKYDITFPVLTVRRCLPREPSSFPNLKKKQENGKEICEL